MHPEDDSRAPCAREPRQIPGLPRGLSRRGFLGGLGGAAALGALAAPQGRAPAAPGFLPDPLGDEFPLGAPLRLKPVLAYQFAARREMTSWRAYGGLHTPEEVAGETRRIEEELKALASRADFPITVLPLTPVDSDEKVAAVPGCECDAILVYAAGGGLSWFPRLAATGIPNIMFLRHRSGPYYLWHEIAHWRFLRRNGDTFEEPNMDVGDIVVDDYDDLCWRLRALYGLRNARGTKVLAIGGLQAYSEPGQRLGPAHAKDVWGYGIETISEEDFARRLQAARKDPATCEEAERQAAALLSRPEVKLETDRRFVVGSFLALRACRDLMSETGATNFGFAHCMGEGVIRMLDTPPCLVLSLANDAGFTAYCHVDLTHTVPGVLLRWIAGRPTFVCNTHFPHHGIFTVAHCAAPRRMDGRGFEPTRIMTHFESDYGAATKVEYRKGQTVTVVVPNLRCTKWLGLRGKIVETPSHPACRSQMDIEVEGDFERLLSNMEGFHAQVVYGDFLKEVGYALKKVGKVDWENVSEEA